MASDPKVIAIGILKKRKGASGADDEGEDPTMPPLEDVAQELIDAVKAGDAKGVAKALRGAQACMSEDGEESDEDDAEG